MLGISTNIDIDAVLFLKTREGSIVVDVRPITKICKMPSKLFLFLQFYTPSQTSASASIPSFFMDIRLHKPDIDS